MESDLNKLEIIRKSPQAISLRNPVFNQHSFQILISIQYSLFLLTPENQFLLVLLLDLSLLSKQR